MHPIPNQQNLTDATLPARSHLRGAPWQLAWPTTRKQTKPETRTTHFPAKVKHVTTCTWSAAPPDGPLRL